jgi:hypothetical protein
MIRSIIVILALVAFVLAGPAGAIKRVPLADDKPSAENQKTNQTTDSAEGKAPPSEPSKKQGNDRQGADKRDSGNPSEAARPEKSKQPEDDSSNKDRIKERDRFIDENGDGLNDRYKKRPEIVKRKKESGDSKESEKDSNTKKARDYRGR